MGSAEDESEEISSPVLSPEKLRGFHGRADKDKNGKASLLELLDYAADMRKVVASQDIQSILQEMDGDKDGKLSIEEVLADFGHLIEDDKAQERHIELEKQKFKAADINSDGFLSAEEIPAVVSPESHSGVLDIVTKDAMAEKDTDGDGKLSFKEFYEGEISEDDFKKLDADGDGVISLEELKPWEGGMLHAQESIKRILEIADKDKDMHLTADELHEAMEKINGDEYINEHFTEFVEHIEL